MSNQRDDFSSKVVEEIAKRAAFICSNPDCRALTVAPTDFTENIFTYIGQAAHITAAAPGGPRYDSAMNSEERKSISNAIFLCSNCATAVDKNNGIGFSVETLREWKSTHDQWVRSNLNKSIPTSAQPAINIVSIGQQGGVTAHTVNIGAAKQKLTENARLQILRKLENVDASAPVTVVTNASDTASYGIAREVREILHQKGFNSRVGQTMGSVYPPGISFRDGPDGLKILVGPE